MGDYGVKISKQGKSVYSGNYYDFSLDSRFANLTVYATGSTTLASINHSLGGVPIVLAYQNSGGTIYPMLPASGRGLVWADANAIHFENTGGDTCLYIIFNEQII